MIPRYPYPIDYMTVVQANTLAQILRQRQPAFNWRLPPALSIDFDYAPDMVFIDGPKSQRIKYGIWLWHQMTKAEQWQFHQDCLLEGLHTCVRILLQAELDQELVGDQLYEMAGDVAEVYRLVSGGKPLDITRPPPGGLYNEERSRRIQTDVPPP